MRSSRRQPDIFVDALSSLEDNSIPSALTEFLRKEGFSRSLVPWKTFVESDYALHPLHVVPSQQTSSQPELALPGTFPDFHPLTLQSDFWNQYPARPSIAQLIAPGASFDAFLQTVHLRYQQTLPPQGLERISFTLSQTWEMYQAYFRSAGL